MQQNIQLRLSSKSGGFGAGSQVREQAKETDLLLYMLLDRLSTKHTVDIDGSHKIVVIFTHGKCSQPCVLCVATNNYMYSVLLLVWSPAETGF